MGPAAEARAANEEACMLARTDNDNTDATDATDAGIANHQGVRYHLYALRNLRNCVLLSCVVLCRQIRGLIVYSTFIIFIMFRAVTSTLYCCCHIPYPFIQWYIKALIFFYHTL